MISLLVSILLLGAVILIIGEAVKKFLDSAVMPYFAILVLIAAVGVFYFKIYPLIP